MASASHGQGAQEAKSPSGVGQFLHSMVDEPRQQSSHMQAQAHSVALTQAAAVMSHTSPVAAAQSHSQSQARAAPQQEPDGSFTTQATSAFEPTGPNMVLCHVGDTIQVLERHASGWTYCKNLSLNSGNNVGWAPSWIVQPVPADEANGVAQRAKAQEAAAHQQAATVQPANSGYAGGLGHQQPATAHASGLQKMEQLHRSSQHAVATAPTPQHSMQAQTQQLRSSPVQQAAVVEVAPLAPKAPSTVVRVATTGFAASSTSQLTVTAGDLVEIVEAHASGWTYGRKVPSSGHFSLDAMGPVEGWFPDWVCAQK